MIEGRHSLEEVIEAVVGRYEIAREQAEADVLRLAEELLQENLVLTSNDEAPGNGNLQQGSQQRQRYEPPQLNIYRDMGDLLALDPPVPGLAGTPWKDPDDELSH